MFNSWGRESIEIMAHYPLERRESVVRRMLNEEVSISALARETGIAEGTLYRWRDAARPNGEAVSTKQPSEKHSATQKFAIVVQAASLNEAELATLHSQIVSNLGATNGGRPKQSGLDRPVGNFRTARHRFADLAEMKRTGKARLLHRSSVVGCE